MYIPVPAEKTPSREQNEGFQYPFYDTHVTNELLNLDVNSWTEPGFDVQEAVNLAGSPILEVAGPTTNGFYFLNNVLLPARPYITNVSFQSPGRRLEQYRHLIIDEVDATQLPYAPNSVGVMMMSCLPAIILTPEVRALSAEDIDKIVTTSENELQAVADGLLDASSASTSLCARIYSEAARVVNEGGLLVVNGIAQEDVAALTSLGFDPKACVTKTDFNCTSDIFYLTMVLRRR